ALPARRAGGHDLPAPVDLRGERAYGPGGVRDGGLDRARGGARSGSPRSPRPALPHVGARPEPGRPAARTRDRARDGRHRAALGRAADISERLIEAPSLPPQPGWSPADIAIMAALELAAHDHQADAPAAGMWAVRWLEGRPATEARSVANRFRLALAYYVGG